MNNSNNQDLGPILLVADNGEMLTFENQIGTMTNSVKDSNDNGLTNIDTKMEIDNLQLTNDLNNIRNASYLINNKSLE